MEVFIVRPFGTKQVIRKVRDSGVQELVSFDFDSVQTELIDVAMQELNLEGGTTGRIFAAGEIREDMFSALLMADIVIADISIHNANVFYELGIRNALRDKTTILIKCQGYDDTPFDIIGYRYVQYDKDDPGGALEDLKKALVESRLSQKRDSPVFNMLPGLEVQDIERFCVVPPEFTEEVALAEAADDQGKLALLAAEAIYFDLDIPALKQVGEALFCMKAYDTGRTVWEKVREGKPEDYKAAERLATIYQRLAEKDMRQNPAEAEKLLAQSDQAIEQLLAMDDALSSAQRAEAYALKGRNAKTRWVAAWMDAPESQRPARALQSDFWEESLRNYELGYYTNLNHYYSGINALALLTTILSLIESAPDAWTNRYFEDHEAADRLVQLKSAQQKVSSAVRFTIEAEKARMVPGDQQVWLDITRADYLCLTNTNPLKVAAAYQRIMQRCDGLQIGTIVKQLLLYRALNVQPANISAALQATGEQTDIEDDNYYILFTGHMMDSPDRQDARFPPKKEAAVKAAITERLLGMVRKQTGKTIMGIAGGACGGDILFHEVCAEAGIPTELYLALPRSAFLAESVSFAGNDWVERFDALYNKLPRHVLAQTKTLPRWLARHTDYDFWERNNLWMLQNALVNGGQHISLMALWNGKSGDGPGGTRHMVEETRKQGGKTEIIDINQID